MQPVRLASPSVPSSILDPLSGHQREFGSIALLLEWSGPTAGVDAMCLSIIKAERQMRRLMTHAVFQSTAFDRSDVPALRELLTSQKSIYFRHLRQIFESVAAFSVAEAFGSSAEPYEQDLVLLQSYRNKLFHGQLTIDSLSRDELVALTRRVAEWCAVLGQACDQAFGYAGFASSYVKLKRPGLVTSASEAIPNFETYQRLLIEVSRPGASTKT